LTAPRGRIAGLGARSRLLPRYALEGAVAADKRSPAALGLPRATPGVSP